MKNSIIFLRYTSKLLLYIGIVLFVNSCEDAFTFELPEANSIPDLVPPAANFSYASTLEDFKTIKFTNLSTESTIFEWDFGGGSSSNDKDPTFTFDSGEGTYPVTLMATDALGVTDVTTIDVLVVEGPFQPIILEPGFEDNTLPDGSGDGRDSWRTSSPSWTTIVGISSSPVTFGSQAGKLEVSSARAGYQEITVEPETNYDLGFWYTMKVADDPWAIVSIVGVTESGPITSQQEAIDGTIASITVSDTDDPSTYVEQKMSFNSGNNNTVAIYFYNDANVETRFDDFTIEVGLPGAVPPSPAFTPEQSMENYLEYTFTNASTNAVSYEWDFGDGNTSTDVSPTHVYATPDTYTVTLIATSAEGLSASLSRDIDIQAPVTAGFTFDVDPLVDYRTYSFTNTSEDAVMLLWEFGDGFQFTGMDPSHTYAEDGIYIVTLTAYSVTGLTDVATVELTVSQGFIAAFEDPGVEDGTTAWRNRDLESNADTFFGFDGTWVVQTSSTFRSGSRSAKLPTFESQGNENPANRRWLYQAVEVEENKDYEISFWIRNKDSGAGTTVTTQVYDAPFDDPAVIDDGSRILASTILNEASGHDTNGWVEAKIQFNSGSSTEVVLFIYNDWTLNVTGGDSESESYMDDFLITEL